MALQKRDELSLCCDTKAPPAPYNTFNPSLPFESTASSDSTERSMNRAGAVDGWMHIHRCCSLSLSLSLSLTLSLSPHLSRPLVYISPWTWSPVPPPRRPGTPLPFCLRFCKKPTEILMQPTWPMITVSAEVEWWRVSAVFTDPLPS